MGKQGPHCRSWGLGGGLLGLGEAAFSVSLGKGPLAAGRLLRTCLVQDCLRACQEQIEALLESSLRQAQQQNLDPKAAEEGEEEEEADLACTPTDVRDVDI